MSHKGGRQVKTIEGNGERAEETRQEALTGDPPLDPEYFFSAVAHSPMPDELSFDPVG